MRYGDFSELALAMRLLARSSSQLAEVLPSFCDDDSAVDAWRAWRARNWEPMGTQVLAAGNFIHEFWHLIQASCRSGGVLRVAGLHSYAAHMRRALFSVRESKRWPPRLPAASWLESVAPDIWNEAMKTARVFDVSVAIRDGDRAFLEDARAAESFKTADDLPQLPALGEIAFGDPTWLGNQSDQPLSLDFLAESEATLVERRFLEFWFGEVGRDVFHQTIRGRLRAEYDVLPILAAADGMVGVLPLLMDWSMQTALTIDLTSLRAHKYPGHRFLTLYAAAGRYRGASPREVTEHYQEIVDNLARATGLPKPEETLAAAIEHIEQLALPHTLKRILVHNGTYRLRYPEPFLQPEYGFLQLYDNLGVGHAIFRGDPMTMWSWDSVLSPVERAELQWEALTAAQTYQIITEKSAACPWCSGGNPNFGAQPAIEAPIQDRCCQCGWHDHFVAVWGAQPQSLLPFSA